MSLINCPECGREISDKAISCPGCGFPISDFRLQETEENEVIVANFRSGYKIIYSIDETEILKDGILLFKGKTSSIKFYGSDKNFFDKGFIQLLTPNYDIPRELKCLDENEYKNCKRIIEHEKKNRKRAKKKCPQCGSSNYHSFVEDVVVDPGKVKSTTSFNLNPLKPFTIYNHKEKVIREPITKQVSKFICDDCGKIFK